MRIVTALFCAIILCAANVHSQGFKNIIVDTVASQQYIGVWSTYYQVSLSDLLGEGQTLTVSVNFTSGGGQISADPLQFDYYTATASFQILSTSPGLNVLAYILGGSAATDYRPIIGSTFYTYLRSVVVDKATSLTLDYPSEPLQVSLQFPSAYDLTFTTLAVQGNVEIQPSQFTIPAGALSATFQILPLWANISIFTISFTPSGVEAPWYNNGTSSYNYNVNVRQFYISPTFPSDMLLGVNSTTYYIYGPPVNETVYVTPQAAGTTFYPSQFEFSGNTTVVPFTMITASPNNPKYITLFVTGDGEGDYVPNQSATAVFTKKIVSIVSPSAFIVGVTTNLTLKISAPTPNDMTVSLYAGNVAFSPATVTFSGNVTSIVVNVIPNTVGPDTIYTTLSGTDMAQFTTPTGQGINVAIRQFFSPSNWYIPILFTGATSPKIPVRVNVAPLNSVTLTPTAQDIIFDPPSLTFDANHMQQYFTASPAPTNMNPNTNPTSSPYVSFIVSGTDAAWYATPTAFYASLKREYVQFALSAHVTDDNTSNQLYLQKQYIIWATVSHPPNTNVTVTPTCPYITFNPAVVVFTPSVTRMQVTATVIAAAGSTNVDLIVGGVDGGNYYGQSLVFQTSLRPLAVYQAVLAPDTRVPGALVTVNNVGVLSTNHVYSFSVASPVIPDRVLTVTPKSNQVLFSPSSITLNVGGGLQTVYYPDGNFSIPYNYVAANFSTTPQAAGTFYVWFELSGDDADYYQRPADVLMQFNEVMLTLSEVPPAASHALSLASLMSLSWMMCMVCVVAFLL